MQPFFTSFSEKIHQTFQGHSSIFTKKIRIFLTRTRARACARVRMNLRLSNFLNITYFVYGMSFFTLYVVFVLYISLTSSSFLSGKCSKMSKKHTFLGVRNRHKIAKNASIELKIGHNLALMMFFKNH